MLNEKIRLPGRVLRTGAEPYLIAEMGSNHDQSLDKARRLIDSAAYAGAQAVKFQLFRADLLYPEGGEMHELFKSIELAPDWLEPLAEHAAALDLDFLASAFDRQSVADLVAIGVPALKVASSETANLTLLAHMARQGLPLLVSTGMCDWVDVAQAVDVCVAAGNPNLALLQCGALYPLSPELANLRVLTAFREAFGGPVGYSDHTLGSTAAVAAVALGACVIEKHLTLDRASPGPDHSYAAEPAELKAFAEELRQAHAALGSPFKTMLDEERRIGRRSGLYAARDLKQAESLDGEALDARRPATGIRDRYREIVAGARLRRDVERDQPIDWDAIEL